MKIALLNHVKNNITVLKIGEYHLDIAQFELDDIQSCDVFRSIAEAKLFDEL